MRRTVVVHPLCNFCAEVLNLKSLSNFLLSVCCSTEGFCEGAPSVRPESLDQPAETHHPDSRGAGSSLRTVEDP